MAGPLKKYSFINAKLRTRISKILTHEFFENLLHSHSLSEAIQLFKDTPFAGIEAVYTKTGDLKMVELELLKHEINLYVEIEKFISSELLSFIRVLATRYEVDNLKNILRLWFDKTIRKRDIQDAQLYIYREKIHFDLQLDRILGAQNLKQVADIIKDTPYSEILIKAESKVNEHQSLFYVETELELYYYTKLLEEVEKLKKTDKVLAKRLIGVEIDMQNINLIIRIKRMYNLPLEEVFTYLLPFGYSINKDALSLIYNTQDVTSVLSGFIKKRYTGLQAILTSQSSDSSSRLILIERVLDEIMMYEVHKVLLANPFTIGIILVYFILKRNEIKKIITLLNAKYYKIPADQIKGRI
ncbi:MAG: V-type ATPase subunit [Spirochaetales bacterium]|nr:V-type ATPase subunit [Spirochaetales bacterium]